MSVVRLSFPSWNSEGVLVDVQVEGSRHIGQPPQRVALNGGRLPAVLHQGRRRLRCHRWELRCPTCAAEEVAEDVGRH